MHEWCRVEETVGWQIEGPQAEVEIWLGHGMNINISVNESKDKIIDKKGKKDVKGKPVKKK